MEDKLQSRCSRIGRRNTLWRPTKMLSPTAQGPARESKKSKPHRASTRLSRQPAARCSTGRDDADPGGAAERRSADGGAPAPCGSGHRPQRRAAGHPAASTQRPAAGGARARGPSPRAARGTRRGGQRSVSGRGGARARAASLPARLRRDLRPGAQRQAGAAPLRQVTGRYDLVSILNFFDLLDL